MGIVDAAYSTCPPGRTHPAVRVVRYESCTSLEAAPGANSDNIHQLLIGVQWQI